ncbi:hypothetical protein [Roseiflexus sp.]
MSHLFAAWRASRDPQPGDVPEIEPYDDDEIDDLFAKLAGDDDESEAS